MKKILAMLLSAFALGCSEKKDEVFTLEEANMCLLESDKHAVMDAGELIKKAESEDDEGLSAEYFEKAYGQIQEDTGAVCEEPRRRFRRGTEALCGAGMGSDRLQLQQCDWVVRQVGIVCRAAGAAGGASHRG